MKSLRKIVCQSHFAISLGEGESWGVERCRFNGDGWRELRLELSFTVKTDVEDDPLSLCFFTFYFFLNKKKKKEKSFTFGLPSGPLAFIFKYKTWA